MLFAHVVHCQIALHMDFFVYIYVFFQLSLLYSLSIHTLLLFSDNNVECDLPDLFIYLFIYLFIFIYLFTFFAVIGE